MHKYILTVLVTLFVMIGIVAGQNKVRISGYVLDEQNHGVEMANVYLENTTRGARTTKKGFYDVNLSIPDSAILVFSSLGYKSIKKTIYPSKEPIQISVTLYSLDNQINQVNVLGQRRQTTTLDLLDNSKLRLMPNTSGGIESSLIAFTGVRSNNELSSQYNVRGGSFDENMVYVNGIEVYRPLLVKSGEQEGLSFVNPDMVKNLMFSAGGFDAKYGDKMSSVLDIEYKKPLRFEANTTMSLLGSSVFVGTSNKKFSQMHGLRYKTAQYLLGSLDTKGEYKPQFFDYQTYLTYQLSPKLDISFLGNVSQNSYQFVPKERETNFGTINQPLNLTIYFEGQEKDLFQTVFGAATVNYKPNVNTKLSLMTSAFSTKENITSDIGGEYILSEIDVDPITSEGKPGETLAVGKYQQHNRNSLNAVVYNLSHFGESELESHKLKWGVTIQNEVITDKINEWEWRDSSGYSLPYSKKQLNLFYNLKSSNNISSLRNTAYLQDTYRWETDFGKYSFTGGVRSNYWTFTKELLLSPRISISLLPKWKKEFSFRFASGLYYQAPFYKELRDTSMDASRNVTMSLNNNLKAQRTLHFLLGGDHYFSSFGRPFKFTTETYLKFGDRIISYVVDNVNIRYSGENDAESYTAGVDFKLSGELVAGAESWINFSLMNSKINFINDNHGWVDSPTEQRYAFSFLFQDYLPSNPKFKGQLKVIWSDGLPFGAPNSAPYLRTISRATPYRRVDLGLSRIIISSSDKPSQNMFIKHIKNAWIGFEVLNLFEISNVNSFYWITHVNKQQLPAPNYLTERMFNLKLIVDFK